MVFVLVCHWGKHRSVGAAASLAQWARWSRYTIHSGFTSLSTLDYAARPWWAPQGSCKFHGSGACVRCSLRGVTPRQEILQEGVRPLLEVEGLASTCDVAKPVTPQARG